MKKKTKVLIILTAAIFFTSIFVMAYSHFNSQVSMNGEQNIARFIFDAESLDEIQLPLVDLNPGDTKEYLFSVTNNKLGFVSNVTIAYQMIIKTYHLIPLTIELYALDGELEELLITCDENFERNEQNEILCELPTIEMKYEEEELDNYKLKVEFQDDYDDAIYADLVDFIKIELKSWQKLEG
ncbi:MAG: hypothetical protein WDA21_03400 [Bacilli bacterium]